MAIRGIVFVSVHATNQQCLSVQSERTVNDLDFAESDVAGFHLQRSHAICIKQRDREPVKVGCFCTPSMHVSCIDTEAGTVFVAAFLINWQRAYRFARLSDQLITPVEAGTQTQVLGITGMYFDIERALPVTLIEISTDA